MKRDWTDGYVGDITYSHGYFHELAPSYLRYFLLVNGHACPSDGGRYTYCELGYGQGVSANVHAAANPRGEFWGTDFNPDHALNASTLARQAGLGAHWLDLSFEGMLETPTPQFDFIVLHGVWSWVSVAAQHVLVEFIRRKLKPGGAVFVSYNVLPGWSAEKPLRDLLWLHTEHASAPDAPTPKRIADALNFARAMRRHGSAFFTENTRASQALDDMLRQDPGSLAHEYFNRSWCLTYFAEIERTLQAASLNFACSVHLSDVSGQVRDRLAGAGFLDAALGTPLRETAADFVLNRRFRRDVFVRGSIRLAPTERLAALDEVKFVLMRPAAEVAMTLATPYGQIPLEEAMVKPLLDMLEAAQHPVSFGYLRKAGELASFPTEDLLLALSRLSARRDVCPVFADDAVAAHDAHAHGLNTAVARRACHDNTMRYLASPVTGSGIEANRFERLFWLAWQSGARSPAELVQAGLALYNGSEGAQVESKGAGTPEEFARRAEHFVSAVVPLWRRLGLIDNRKPKARK